MKKEQIGYKYVPFSQIIPRGWMKELLERYASGLLSNLEEVWEDVGTNNAWLGGSGDAWERGPYYVDGLVPMAFLLKDKNLIAKAERWIESTISSQTEDGNFGPSTNDDWWPRFIMLKAVIQYADCLDDDLFYKRVEQFISRYLDYFLDNIEFKPFSMWAYVRGGELLHSILWIYNRTLDGKYLKIGRIVMAKSLDWKSFFQSMPFTMPTECYMPWQNFQEYLSRFNSNYIEPMQKRRFDDPFFRIFHQTHGVNIAMGLKYIAYEYALDRTPELLELMHSGYELLLKYHGQVTGLFSCDEHLNGRNPEKGTELCTVVELMFSLEEIIRITGDLSWMDLLEQIGFNALPATISSDGCSHQYDQQVNQYSCTIDKREWYNNLDDSNIFGLEPNFGCCTANMHQGMPKFNRLQWINIDNSWTCLSFYSSKVSLEHGLSVEIKSNYPFDGQIDVKIESESDCIVMFRIPFWCKDPHFDNGRLRNDGLIETTVSKGINSITIDFPMEIEFLEDSYGSYFKRGSIIFSLPIEKEVSQIVDRGRFSDWEYKPVSSCEYFVDSSKTQYARVEYPEVFFMNKKYKDSIKLKIIGSDVEGNAVELLLVPYGSTDLRKTIFQCK